MREQRVDTAAEAEGVQVDAALHELVGGDGVDVVGRHLAATHPATTGDVVVDAFGQRAVEGNLESGRVRRHDVLSVGEADASGVALSASADGRDGAATRPLVDGRATERATVREVDRRQEVTAGPVAAEIAGTRRGSGRPRGHQAQLGLQELEVDMARAVVDHALGAEEDLVDSAARPVGDRVNVGEVVLGLEAGRCVDEAVEREVVLARPGRHGGRVAASRGRAGHRTRQAGVLVVAVEEGVDYERRRHDGRIGGRGRSQARCDRQRVGVRAGGRPLLAAVEDAAAPEGAHGRACVDAAVGAGGVVVGAAPVTPVVRGGAGRSSVPDVAVEDEEARRSRARGQRTESDDCARAADGEQRRQVAPFAQQPLQRVPYPGCTSSPIPASAHRHTSPLSFRQRQQRQEKALAGTVTASAATGESAPEHTHGIVALPWTEIERPLPDSGRREGRSAWSAW